MNEQQMYLTTAADGHALFVMENVGVVALLKVRWLLRFRYGFRRAGKVIEGFGEAIYPDFVRGPITLKAAQDDMVGYTLHASNEESDVFLREFAQRHAQQKAAPDAG